MLLGLIRASSHYWATVAGTDGPKTVQERLDGLAFSILVAMDGCTELPAFKIIPLPHPSDRQYCEDGGENWWPDDLDIGGSLHDEWHRKAGPEECDR